MPPFFSSLKRKESFSEKKAGEYFAEQYLLTRGEDEEANWWDSDRFIQRELSRFLELLFGKQYSLFQDWKRERNLDGIYFLISGRPTKAPKVRRIIQKYILREFNRDELILLPEHCLFMADYYHVGKNEEGERYAKKLENFEKLITILGNVYTLYDGYEIDFEDHRYYITLDVDTRCVNNMEIRPGKHYNLEEFENYQKAAVRNNVNHLAFSRMPNSDNGTRFLTVKKIASQTAYPTIKVAERSKNEQAFDLAWASHA